MAARVVSLYHLSVGQCESILYQHCFSYAVKGIETHCYTTDDRRPTEFSGIQYYTDGTPVRPSFIHSFIHSTVKQTNCHRATLRLFIQLNSQNLNRLRLSEIIRHAIVKPRCMHESSLSNSGVLYNSIRSMPSNNAFQM